MPSKEAVEVSQLARTPSKANMNEERLRRPNLITADHNRESHGTSSTSPDRDAHGKRKSKYGNEKVSREKLPVSEDLEVSSMETEVGSDYKSRE